MRPEHFRIEELVDKKTFEREGEAAWDRLDDNALRMLDDVAEFFRARSGYGIVVNNWHVGGTQQWRGIRTVEKAKELGATKSMHISDPAQGVKCRAFDCTVRGYTAARARELILANKDHILLRRIMRIEGDVTWLHIDTKSVQQRIYVFHA